ncbi:hypothetical protein TeGR_g12830 [Tetraparma gracilis]|uniref:JmjC domain-containing protein n=1 Tax=Tetraparma gracilis TaxID=2962635 RepID=A0ABQ6M4Y7_9STRA|nr:hypothetical protein TeGR_g12830 [Tetraparma gracilis]
MPSSPAFSFSAPSRAAIIQLRPFLHSTEAYKSLSTEKILSSIPADTAVSLSLPAGDELDGEGRAAEAPTMSCAFADYVEKHQHDDDPPKYLKDMHYAGLFPTLTPELFADMDILGPFLRRYNLGDYDFMYWGGSAGTGTPIHSDVMLSHSYSYNVEGIKEWTFYPPNEEAPGSPPLVVQQRAGEVMFVPSGLYHSVRNLTPALSLNRNWVTPSIAPRVLATVLKERTAVDEELEKWGLESDLAEQEKMLASACGLSVSSCLLMFLEGAADRCERLGGLLRAGEGGGEKLEECALDFFVLCETIHELLRDDMAAPLERLVAVRGGEAGEAARQGIQCLQDRVAELEKMICE